MAENEAPKGQFTFNDAHPAVFLNLFEPKSVTVNGKPSGDPKYSANFLLDPEHPDYAAARAVAIAVAKEYFPGRKMSELKWPWENGDEAAAKAEKKGKKREFYKGKIVLVTRTKHAPTLGSIKAGSYTQFDGDRRASQAAKDAFYMGVKALGVLQFRAYDGVGNNPDGVTAYLQSIVSTNKGDKIQGPGRDLAETFKGYIGLQKDVDVGGSVDGDDDIPF